MQSVPGSEAQNNVALVVGGLGGLGSSLLAGIEAARSNLAHPFGSLVEAGGAGALPGASPLRQLAPFAELGRLALGAFELRPDDAFRAALRAGLLPRALLEQLGPALRRVRAMAGARQAPTRRHLADSMAEDLRGFLAHHGCSRGVLVCTVPGPPDAPKRQPRTAAELFHVLEDAPDQVTPGMVHAAAALQAGFAFVAAAPDASLSAPALHDAFERAGLPLAGAGLLGPEAALREALAALARDEELQLQSCGSLAMRAGDATGWRGTERVEELACSPSFGGGALELSLGLRGPLSLHLAGRALDAALLVDLAAQAGRAGAQEWMGALFSAPLSEPGLRKAAPASLAARRAVLLAEVPRLASAVPSRQPLRELAHLQAIPGK